jgi:hypothetical protein
VPRFFIEVGRFEQGFAWDAPDAEAGTAETVIFVDAGDVQAELCGADRGDITARAAPEDDEVMASRFHGKASWVKVCFGSGCQRHASSLEVISPRRDRETTPLI